MIALLLIPLCFTIDQYSKNKALKHQEDLKDLSYLNNAIRFKIVYNEGAFLGLLKKHKKLLLMINSVSMILLALLIWTMLMVKGFHLVKIGLCLIFGGALGNLYDRVKRKKVVDFFSIPIKRGVYYNIADMFIFIGAALLAMGYLFSEI